MTLAYVVLALAVLALTIPYIGRTIRGPTVFDRVVGLNGIGTKVPILLIFIVLTFGQVDMIIDVVLGLFLLNLVATLLVAKYAREKRGA